MLNTLNVAQSGLNAAKVAVENVMNNVANENTPGYKKRTVILNEMEHLDARITGRGVGVGGVVRANDHYMYTNLIDEGTKESYFVRNNTLFSSVEALFKETDETGFSADLNRYFQSIESLRTNPNNEVFKNSMKTEGNNLVDSIKRLYEGIEKQEEIAINALEDDIESINGLLQDIGKINEQLGQQLEASNDLLDKRDQLELELSQYIDIEVNRGVDDDYELKIAGVTAVRHSTNVRDVTLVKEFEPQKDRYINDDGATSSILNGVTFDNQDQIVFKIDNESEVSVQFGESMTFDLDGDGNTETITVDETNYVRALVHKINTDADISQKVKAYNGNYATDENGNKVTLDNDDKFLLLESKVPGMDGTFDSRVVFVERPLDVHVDTPPPGPLTLKGIEGDTKQETAGPLSHTVTLDGASLTDVEYDFSIADGTALDGTHFDAANVTFTNGVTYDSATGKITVPPGVNEFEVQIPTIDDGAGTGDTSYTLNIGSLSATGNIHDQTSPVEVVEITTETGAEGNVISHTVNLTGGTAAGQTFDVDLNGVTAELNVDFDALVAGDFIPAPVAYTPPVSPATIGTVEFPPGTTSFTINVRTNQDTAGEIDQTYNLSVTDTTGPNTVNATGTITDDDDAISKIIYKDDAQSNEAKDIVGVAVYDKIIDVNTGSLKSNIDNLHTDSGNNKFSEFKKQLDEFAFALSDMSDMYIKNGDGDYVYGEQAIDDIGTGTGDIRKLGLFTGSSVSDLKFNSDAINDLDQDDLDYLATFQFKKDIVFNGKPQGSTNPDYQDVDASSFSEFYQSIRVGVSETKESNDFLLDTQKTVKQSIQSNYDQLVKVDKDEEMLLLVQFQAAYTANAKVVTTIDEMIQTILGLKR